MSITYRIEENNLQPGTFYARVLRGDTIDLQDMIPNVVAKTSLSGSDLQGAVSALREEIIAALAAGNSVTIDGIVTFYVSLSGSFDTPDVIITREMANLKLQAQCDRGMESTVAGRANYNQQVSAVKAPIINSIFDAATKTYDQYTAGSVLQLKGDLLKFDSTQPDEGVFLHDGTTETRVAVYSALGNRQIDALIPPETQGDLTITVRARYTPGGELRQTSFRRPVTPAWTAAPLS